MPVPGLRWFGLPLRPGLSLGRVVAFTAQTLNGPGNARARRNALQAAQEMAQRREVARRRRTWLGWCLADPNAPGWEPGAATATPASVSPARGRPR